MGLATTYANNVALPAAAVRHAVIDRPDGPQQ